MKRSSLLSNTDKSAANSSNNTFNDYESLGSDHDQAPEVQAPSLDAGLSSVRVTRRWGVPSKQMYTIESILLSGSSTISCEFVFLSYMIKNEQQ